MAKPRKLTPVAEDESYFVSMTDLMVGMLFIFIIMLMAFALNLREQEHKFVQTTTTLTNANEARRKMLEDIKQAMKKQGVKVIVDPENGVLRLPEELLFERGEFELTPKGHDALQRLGEVLAQTLPCYADDPTRQGVACPKTNGGRLEAVFIEGHTDDRQIAGRMKNGISSNWELSTERAIATFNALVQQAKSLADINNDSHLKLLGVSGYAENRPVSTEDTEVARASNRRIDLRFLMATPNTEELARIRQNVETGIVHP